GDHIATKSTKRPSTLYVTFTQKLFAIALEQHSGKDVAYDSRAISRAMGRSMSRPVMHDDLPLAAVPASSRKRYVIVRREDAWFIAFEGEEFGPYQSEREALLFAIDAAHKLGEKGEGTQVLQADEIGDASPVWTFGI